MTNDLSPANSPRGTTLAHARWADPADVAEKHRYVLDPGRLRSRAGRAFAPSETF